MPFLLSASVVVVVVVVIVAAVAAAATAAVFFECPWGEGLAAAAVAFEDIFALSLSSPLPRRKGYICREKECTDIAS